MALMLLPDVKISIDCKFQAHNVRKTKDRDVLVKCSLSRNLLFAYDFKSDNCDLYVLLSGSQVLN